MAGRLPLIAQNTGMIRSPWEDFDLPDVEGPSDLDRQWRPQPLQLPRREPIGTTPDTIEGEGYPGPGAGEFDIPGAFGGATRGTASMGGRVGGAELALAGLAKAQRGDEGFAPSRAQMAQMVAARQASPENYAAGSGAYWGSLLGEEKADADLARTERLKQILGTEGAIQGMHPAIQEAEERTALRKSYPQRVAGEADIQAAQIGAGGRQRAAEIAAQGRRVGASGQAAAAALRALQEAYSTQFDSPEDRQAAIEDAQRALNAISMGEFFSPYDFEEEDESGF